VEFVLLFMERRAAPMADARGFAAMSRFASELASQGKLRRGAPLTAESEGARVRVRKRGDEHEASVVDGPFVETKEVIGGFWIVDVASRAEAIDIARRCPHACHGTVEVHHARQRYSFPDSEVGTPFLLLFHQEPGSTDPDGSRMRDMIRFGERLRDGGALIETAPLASEPPAARVQTRETRVLVTDGPFAETKEAVGGYGIVRAAGRDEAIEIATRYPHARWGTVEVREIRFFDET
jgi:hypothetical protein